MDKLIARRNELKARTQILDLAAYAEEWNWLAADFEAIGAQMNAALCFAAWRHYAMLAAGSYVFTPALELAAIS